MLVIYIYIYCFKQIPKFHFCEQLFVVYAGLINTLLINLLIKFINMEYCNAKII
jgi:hypothetical protein